MATQQKVPTVDALFAKSAPEVRKTYDAIRKASRELGRIVVEPKKTSIHLVRSTAFAGIAARKEALILTVKASAPIRSPRVHRAEQTSANRWHVEFRLTSPAEVDHEVRGWLREAYELAG
jgi:hypothetical protein